LYLLDYSGENLPNLKETIVSKYPDVKVSSFTCCPMTGVLTRPRFKVTTIQADASDDKAIQHLCNQAINDEGKLDVFFANVRRDPASISLGDRISFDSGCHRQHQPAY
jgi:hypothetical protein